MLEPQEMYTASRMQNIMYLGTNSAYYRLKSLPFFLFFTFRVLGVESPRGGATISQPTTTSQPATRQLPTHAASHRVSQPAS